MGKYQSGNRAFLFFFPGNPELDSVEHGLLLGPQMLAWLAALTLPGQNLTCVVG